MCQESHNSKYSNPNIFEIFWKNQLSGKKIPKINKKGAYGERIQNFFIIFRERTSMRPKLWLVLQAWKFCLLITSMRLPDSRSNFQTLWGLQETQIWTSTFKFLFKPSKFLILGRTLYHLTTNPNFATKILFRSGVRYTNLNDN